MARVLRIGIVLMLVVVTCVRCEMRKSWKVKSANPVEEELPKQVLVKQSRMELEDPEQNLVESRTEQIEQRTSPVASSSTTAQATTKSRLRSTYVANRTSTLFNSLRESVKAAPFLEDHVPDIQIDDFSADDAEDDEFGGEERDDRPTKDAKAKKNEEDPYAEGYEMIENILDEVKSIASGEKPIEKPEEKFEEPAEKVKQYDFGPVLNMTIDEPNNIVNVKLNEKVLKDIFTGRGSGGFGGGSKKMWKYAMPLFILPFLIQSAVVPFMLMTVKLFLFKSFLAGKLAIFLLLLGAFKNFTQKKDKDVYIKDLPERRYEPYNEWPYPYHSEGSGRPSWA